MAYKSHHDWLLLPTFAYLGDVFVLEAFRGQGLSKWLMEVIGTYPELQGLRR